jgi:SAM-dependent methyltransferase
VAIARRDGLRPGALYRANHLARRVWWKARWSRRPYSAYQRHLMDSMAAEDPKEAVGGMWDVIGPFQLENLKRHGLLPHHMLLDIGCGSLRGGLHFIRYLERGHYWGTDLSLKLLDSGRRFVAVAGLQEKLPRLMLAQDFSFRQLDGARFDFVQAFGVLTDVPAELAEACFSNLHRVLAPGGRFYATFGNAGKYREDRYGKKFWYPASMLQEMGSRAGFEVLMATGFSRLHPKGHSLIMARTPATRESSVPSVVAVA